MIGARVVMGALGLATAGLGVSRLLELGPANLVATVLWLAAGVVLHDGLLAPLTVALGVLVARAARLPAPVLTGLVVLGSVTVVAVPVLGRFGARPDNPTLLDRNYVLGWLGLATLTVLCCGIVAVVRRKKGGVDGASAGRR
ncbi:MAG TPA: hypothetical protein VHO29_12195 [Marmoricola sp.]|nr:hypothetical protein [Marmoricola sp.]